MGGGAVVRREPPEEEKVLLAALGEARRSYDAAWQAFLRAQEGAPRWPAGPTAQVQEARERLMAAGRRLRQTRRALRVLRATRRAAEGA